MIPYHPPPMRKTVVSMLFTDHPKIVNDGIPWIDEECGIEISDIIVDRQWAQRYYREHLLKMRLIPWAHREIWSRYEMPRHVDRVCDINSNGPIEMTLYIDLAHDLEEEHVSDWYRLWYRA